MNDREYFHESVVRDVVDILTSLKDYDEVNFLTNSSNRRSFKSISSATKDLILTFPVLVSSDLSPDNACMVAKAHEKKCASMLHMLFTAICVDSNEDIYDFVQKFHSNLGSMNGTLDSYADSLDAIAAAIDENVAVYNIDRDALSTVLEELKNSNHTLPDSIRESGIERFKIIPGSITPNGKDIITEDKKNNTKIKVGDHGSNFNIAGHSNTYKAASDNVTTTNIYHGASSASDVANRSTVDMNKSWESQNKAHNNKFLNNEYKKANELMPTMMVVNFIAKDSTSDSNARVATSAIIGVKAKIYPVSSDDICNRLSSKVEDRNVLTNFVRATTNEIGFFRDFLFAIDKAKIDAKSYGNTASSNKLWKVLERRSVKSKFRRSLRMYNDATAITLLTVSANDVDYMKKNFNNLDLASTPTARKILDAYNFMGICILDEGVETASFLYDTGDDNYERLTFSNLEREASDSSYKKIVNLLTKMNR